MIRRSNKTKCSSCKGIGKAGDAVCDHCKGYGSRSLYLLEKYRRNTNQGRGG